MTNSLSAEQSAIVDKLLRTGKLHAFNEIAEASKELAGKPGIYSWWFKETPPGIPDERTIMRESKTLLYVGIAGDRKRRSPKDPRYLKERLNDHTSRNCGSSTLRFSLAATLSESLGIHGKKRGKKVDLLEDGEQKLTNWMEHNAFVIWVTCNDPDPIEDYLVENSTNGGPRLPFNIDQSKDSFRTSLEGLRADLKCSS